MTGTYATDFDRAANRWSARTSPSATGSTVTQERIDLFADATGDHQWIHVDPERAAAGPFGTHDRARLPDASLLPEMFASAFAGARHAHGRQLRPEPGALPGAGAGRQPAARPLQAARSSSRSKAARSSRSRSRMEREGSDKPVCVAESVARRYTECLVGASMLEAAMKVLLIDDHPLILSRLADGDPGPRHRRRGGRREQRRARRARRSPPTPSFDLCCSTCASATPTASTCWSSCAPPTRRCRWSWSRPPTAAPT